MKSLRGVVETIGLRLTIGIVRGRIVLSIVEEVICLKLWRILERRDGHDVYDQDGSSAPSTSGHPRFWFVAATIAAIVAVESDLHYEEDRMAKIGRLFRE